MALLHVAGLAAIPSYLLLVATPRQIAHPYCRPTKLRHDFRQTPKRARSPVALRDLKQVQQRLRTDALQPIKKVDFAAHALQREPPGIGCSLPRQLSPLLLSFSPGTTALSLLGLPVV